MILALYILNTLISVKLRTTVEIEACNLVRKQLAKIACRKFSKILKRAILKNSCRKVSMVESAFNKIVVIDSRSTTLMKRSFHQGGLSVDKSEFELLLPEGLTWIPVLVKLSVVHSRAAAFIKTLTHHRLFLKMLYIRQLVFETFSKKNLWWSPSIAYLQSV